MEISSWQLNLGILLIVLGLLFLLNNFFPGLSFWKLWPLLLVFAGVVMLIKKGDKKE